MNFINLTVFFLTLMIVPDDVRELTIDTGADQFRLVRAEAGVASWSYYIGGDQSTAYPVSSNGRTMNLQDEKQQTINFMDQYLNFTTNTVWDKVDVISFKALRPPSPIEIKRDAGSMEIIHEHEKHPFQAAVAWKTEPKEEAAATE